MRSGSSFGYSNPNSLGTNMNTMVINDELIDNMLIDEQSDDVEMINETDRMAGARKNTSAHLTDINEMMAQFNMELLNLKRKKSFGTYTDGAYTQGKGSVLYIILWIILLYTAICSSYLAYAHFFTSSECPCSETLIADQNSISNATVNATSMPTATPTMEPTMLSISYAFIICIAPIQTHL